MPKEKRVFSSKSWRSRSSPCPSVLDRGKQRGIRNQQEAVGNHEGEWEEVVCPFCMETPHNAVLLKCSSHEKGCRPYVCNTSLRHSNCLDKFYNSVAASPPSTVVLQDGAGSSGSMPSGLDEQEEESLVSLSDRNLSCPLCRGKIHGWIVVEPIRKFLNTKIRCCSCETCDVSGTYSELRKHARSEHPSVSSTEVDPERQSEWRRMEEIRDYGDMFVTFGSDLERMTGYWINAFHLLDERLLDSPYEDFDQVMATSFNIGDDDGLMNIDQDYIY